jgi:hypothetical protein
VDKRVTDDDVERPAVDDADEDEFDDDAHWSILPIDETAMLNPFIKEGLFCILAKRHPSVVSIEQTEKA